MQQVPTSLGVTAPTGPPDSSTDRELAPEEPVAHQLAPGETGFATQLCTFTKRKRKHRAGKQVKTRRLRVARSRLLLWGGMM